EANPEAMAQGNPGPVRQLGGQAFAKAMRTARSQISAGQFRDALHTLSIFHGSPDLTAEEHTQLLDLLDPLAGRVVYSTEHLLEEAYEVRRNETLFDIAERYQVPWQLLQNINGVRDPQVLVPGTKLKVVPGPFRAEVGLERGELTVFLGRLYAGRFPVTFGQDPPPVPGSYEIRDKRFDRAYYGGGSGTIPADDPRNPYGGIWLDLGQELCIHGSPPTQGPAADRLGCISLSPRDARDVYGILSPGSQVVIRR
ncbi:MAG: LysM peptidoglycan-binding domain-containing protein, partial [Pirellulaceae bacterium]|nr:LysM peptidoglycan-binding domain-containing protein [Pirellulaceae bacterium]